MKYPGPLTVFFRSRSRFQPMKITKKVQKPRLVYHTFNPSTGQNSVHTHPLLGEPTALTPLTLPVSSLRKVVESVEVRQVRCDWLRTHRGNSIMGVACVSFANHTKQPVTTIKQMRWSHTQTERTYNIPDMTNYIMNSIYLFT